jgi:hypothetical protein
LISESGKSVVPFAAGLRQSSGGARGVVRAERRSDQRAGAAVWAAAVGVKRRVTARAASVAAAVLNMSSRLLEKAARRSG